MKKQITLLVFGLTVTFLLNAQLQVHTDGSIQTGFNGYANFYMGNYSAGGYNNGQWGIEVCNGGFNIWKPWPSVNWGNYKLFIAENGNVGIGKSPSDGFKLDVDGNIAVYGAVYVSSDKRLKTDITALTSEISDLYKLNAKSYKKQQPTEELVLPEQTDSSGHLRPGKNFPKTKKAGKVVTEYGFLAQDLQAVYPNLVIQDTLGYLTVNYTSLIPIMVETLKEQKLQIDAQAKQIQALIDAIEKKK